MSADYLQQNVPTLLPRVSMSKAIGLLILIPFSIGVCLVLDLQNKRIDRLSQAHAQQEAHFAVVRQFMRELEDYEAVLGAVVNPDEISQARAVVQQSRQNRAARRVRMGGEQ